MRIIKRKEQMEAVEHIMGVLDILESLPKSAFGNSADAVQKMSALYYETAQLAYITAGVEGLNLCIEFFGRRATNIDEIIAVSKAHLRVISKNTKKKKEKKKK